MAAYYRKKAEEVLLLALACGATAEGAARQCQLSERTVYRRLADADFRRRLHRVRAELAQRTAGALTAAGMEAVKTLLDLQKAPAPAGVRLAAARAVLEIGVKLRDVAELEERLAALEQELAADGPRS